MGNASRTESTSATFDHPLTNGIEIRTETGFDTGGVGIGVGANLRHSDARAFGDSNGKDTDQTDVRMHPLILATRARWTAKAKEYGVALEAHHSTHPGVPKPRTRLRQATRTSVETRTARE